MNIQSDAMTSGKCSFSAAGKVFIGTLLANGALVSISVFSVVYFSIDGARREQTIANTSAGRRKIQLLLSIRLQDPADGDIHY
jgi:hypothetical protein